MMRTSDLILPLLLLVKLALGLALLWQIFAADERDGIPKSVFQ
jgi:hypothetical protein